MTRGDMKPGDLRTFRRGNGEAVVLAIGIWAGREGKNRIRIDITGTKDFHTTVTNDPESERYHRTLFRNLRRVLIANGCWPFRDQGAETEKAGEAT